MMVSVWQKHLCTQPCMEICAVIYTHPVIFRRYLSEVLADRENIK